jgi:hypothetical protein
VIPDLIVAPATPPLTEEDVMSSPKYTAGSTIYFQRGNWPEAQSAAALAKLLRQNKLVDAASVSAADVGMLGQTVYIFDVSGRSASPSLSLFENYRYFLGNVNFFGSDISKIRTFSSKSFDENSIIWYGFVDKISDLYTGDLVVACDDNPAIKISAEAFLRGGMKDCKDGIATPQRALDGISALLSYKFKNILQIPILPTALSSIFLTGIIYLTLLTWTLLPTIRVLLNRYTEKGEVLLEDNVFKVTAIFFYVAAASGYALF